MSTVYEVKMRTTVKQNITPLLYEFLDKSINTKEEPTSDYFQQFQKSEIAENAFYFIRYSKPPELMYAGAYDESEVINIANSWIKHSRNNVSDSDVIGNHFLINDSNEPDLSKLASKNTLRNKKFSLL